MMMTKRRALIAGAALLAGLSVNPAGAVPAVGQPAPGFSLTSTDGKTVRLADFQGRHVVLEWVNPGCPYVRKHYNSANMQGTQKEVTTQGVVWLAVNSTENASADYLAPAELGRWMQTQQAAATHTLLDEDGSVGKAYGARTTPHMYIVDPKGVLVYAGGIDSIPSARAGDIQTAVNYIKQGVRESLAGQPIRAASTRPYGCAIKYKS